MSTGVLDKPLAFRARPDVMATATCRAGTWVVRDPLTCEHYELSAGQWFVATCLQASTSLKQLRRRYEQEFLPERTDEQTLWHLVSELHRWGIVVATGSGQRAAVIEGRRRRRAARWKWGWMQLLAIKLPGVRRWGWLDSLYAVVRPLLGTAGLLSLVALVMAALALVITHFDAFVARLPAVSALWTPQLVVVALATVLVVKALHELGHAVVARHVGVEPDELGVMLLCGMPTLYCDVSQAWQLPRRRDRLAIAAAGMGVEWVLAAVASVVWWFAAPGVVQTVALAVMGFATLGTLLVNGNPLLRYDGYYLLSDVTSTSNLWQRSRAALREWSGGWLWHPLPGQPPVARERLWIALYGLLSHVYLTVLLASLAIVAWRVADAAEMPVLGFAAAALLLGAMLAPPARGTVQVLANPVARGRWRWGRASGLGILLVALVVGVAMWPIRYRVACPVRVELAQGIDVAATQAGELEWAIAPGTAVQAGAPVARLMSREFALELQTSQAAVDAARLRVAQIEKLRPHDPQAAAELPRAQQQLQAAEQLFGQLKQQAERLVLVAPTAGRAIEPADRPARESAANLAHWSGTPLDNENRGAWIAVGDVVATIATTQHRELRLGIAERHVSRVEPGQRVRAQLSAWPGHVVEGRVVSIAQVGGDPSDARQWQTAWLDSLSEQIRYEAKIAIDEPLARVPIASGGRAKIEVGRTTVGATLARWWRELFAID